MASAIHLLVHIERLSGGARKITEISEIVGMEGDIITSQEIFLFRQAGVDDQGRAVGHFETTGIRPKVATRMHSLGIDLPVGWFTQRLRFPG